MDTQTFLLLGLGAGYVAMLLIGVLLGVMAEARWRST
jgi:hypothetical protein